MIETLKKFIVDANFIQGIHKQKPLYREIQVQVKPLNINEALEGFTKEYEGLMDNQDLNVFTITLEGLERYFELLGIDKSKYGSIKIVPKIR